MPLIFNRYNQNMKGIYGIVNLITSHLYVGSSTDVWLRIQNHVSALRHGQELYRNGNSPLQKAWDKHGESAFVFVILEEYTGDDWPADRNALEQKHIDVYWNEGVLYNVSPLAHCPPPRVGPPRRGWKRSPEANAKMIESRRRNGTLKRTDETKEKLRKARTGSKTNPEVLVRQKATYRENFEKGLHRRSRAYKASH